MPQVVYLLWDHRDFEWMRLVGVYTDRKKARMARRQYVADLRAAGVHGGGLEQPEDIRQTVIDVFIEPEPVQ